MGSLIRRNSSGAGAGGGGGGGGGATKRFQYRPRTAEELKDRQRQQGGTRDSFFTNDAQFFTAKQGDNDLRLMPPTWEGAKHYGFDLYVHYGIGADESAYLCLDKMKGEKCPVCEERERAAGAGEQDYADSLRPSKRVAVYVVDRKEEGKGPLIWNMPWTVDRDVSNLSVDSKTGEIYSVDNPDEGYDVQFKREGADQRTKYTGIQIARRSSPLIDDSATFDKWLQYVVDHPIPACLNFFAYEHIANAFNAASGGGSIQDRAAANPRVQERRDAASAGGAATAQRGPLAPRGQPAAAAVPAARPAAAAPATAEPDGNLPSWDEVSQMSEEQLGAVGEAYSIDFPDNGFNSIEEIRLYVCEKLGIKQPAAATPAKTDWRSKLANMTRSK